MFVRTTKVRDKKGVTREYLRLVQSVRTGGKVKQRVVANLGSKELLSPHVDRIAEILRGDKAAAHPAGLESEAVGAWTWGPILAVRALWNDLGLGPTLDGLSRRRRARGPGMKVALSERAFVLVANRLCCPGSEHALADWLEDHYVCDSAGRRWVPRWKQAGRVRVDHKQLAIWYRTLDQLIELKDSIEVALYRKLRDLFSLKIDLVFYDLTSTYFEGKGPGIAKHGHSRDHRPRDPQVLIGVVMVNGFPIAHHVFAGNLRDSTTLQGVLADLASRFEIGRVVLVADRGMVTTANLEMLREQGHGYLLGLARRRREDVFRLIEGATGEWLDCPVGITASEMTDPPRTRVQEVQGDEPGVRVFVVDSEDRAEYERSMREKSMARTRDALEKLRIRVRDGKLRRPEKIGAAAGRIIARNHGYRYFDWELSGGSFRFFEHANLQRERAYEGKYLIRTKEPGLGPVEAVRAYKELSEVERGFAQLKDIIEVRPVYHQNESRVRAHIFVAALAFLVARLLEHRLKRSSCSLSATSALRALQPVRLVEIDLGNERRRFVTRRTARAAQVLSSLRVRAVEPPSPPEGDETLM